EFRRVLFRSPSIVSPHLPFELSARTHSYLALRSEGRVQGAKVHHFQIDAIRIAERWRLRRASNPVHFVEQGRKLCDLGAFLPRWRSGVGGIERQSENKLVPIPIWISCFCFRHHPSVGIEVIC